jgi:hypothetical protein
MRVAEDEEVKTANQTAANVFDCDLYRLIVRAEKNAEHSDGASRANWTEVVARLRKARTMVRLMMHEQDRRESP